MNMPEQPAENIVSRLDTLFGTPEPAMFSTFEMPDVAGQHFPELFAPLASGGVVNSPSQYVGENPISLDVFQPPPTLTVTMRAGGYLARALRGAFRNNSEITLTGGYVGNCADRDEDDNNQEFTIHFADMAMTERVDAPPPLRHIRLDVQVTREGVTFNDTDGPSQLGSPLLSRAREALSADPPKPEPVKKSRYDLIKEAK